MASPCNWTIDTGCCSEWSEFSDALKARATSYATTVLWSATGRQYGLCEITVRPCGRWCENSAGWWWDYGTWIPYIYNGVWYNCACGFGDGCQSCKPNCQIYLPGPVASVSAVTLSGSLIDAATYRVDDGVWLVRTGLDPAGNRNCWPYQQNFNNDPGGDNVLTVTMMRGTPVPDALAVAAGALACEYAKACMGQECRLPGRISSVARQGVSVTMVDVDTLIKSGLTGIAEVDNVIRALNPSLLKGRTRFYSPDSPVNRMTTTA